MKKQTVIAWILLALSLLLGVVSFFVLPDTVITEFSVNGSNVSTMPKPYAVLLPTALGAGGALAVLLIKGDEKSLWKRILVSAVGILVFALMLAVNL